MDALDQNTSCLPGWRALASGEFAHAVAARSPSPAPWTFADRIYGLAHCLIDRDGRVIGCNLPIGNGPLIEQAPAMAELFRELVAGASVERVRERASAILRVIERDGMPWPSRMAMIWA